MSWGGGGEWGRRGRGAARERRGGEAAGRGRSARAPRHRVCAPPIFFPSLSRRPSFEQHAGTPTGKKCVAKHNTMIRLATVRYGMLEPLRRPPPFFERAVAAHFFFKRAELEAQCAQWAAEAKAAAAFEAALDRAVADAAAAHKAARDADVAVWQLAHPGAAPHTAGGYTEPPPGAAAAAAHAKLLSRKAAWAADVSSHNVFAGGLAGLPKAPTAAYAPEAAAGAAQSAAAAAAQYAFLYNGGGGGASYLTLAAALDHAVGELKAELAKLKPPADA